MLTFARGHDAVPETIEIIIPRLAVGFMFLLPSSGRLPAIWLSAIAPLMILALLGLGTLQSAWGSPLSRVSWVMDSLVLGILTPILVVNAFAATGSSPLRHAESLAYLETIVAAMVSVIGLILYGSRLRGQQALSWGILFLPAALTPVALLSAYADFKTTSVVLALSISWFISVGVTAVARGAAGGFAILVPIVSYAVYVVSVALMTHSGLAFGGRPAPVSFVHPVLVVVLGISLLAPLVPSVEKLSRHAVPPRRTARTRRGSRAVTTQRPQRRSRLLDDGIDLDDLEEFRT